MATPLHHPRDKMLKQVLQGSGVISPRLTFGRAGAFFSVLFQPLFLSLGIVFWILAFVSFPAGASGSACRTAFGEKSEAWRGWEDWPTASSAPLPPAFVEILHQHPVLRQIRTRWGRGEQVAFTLAHLGVGDKSGWGVQSVFVQKVLAEMLPSAAFVGSPENKAFQDRRRFEIEIEDLTMDPGRTGPFLDMTALKAANPGPQLPSRDILRERLGLPKTARVAALYSSWTHKFETLGAIRLLLKKDLADLVILSFQDARVLKHPEAGLETLERDLRARVVINRTRGRMPYIYGASDYAVVLGQANVMEPLQIARPTFVTRAAGENFDQDARDRMLQVFSLSGSAHIFSDFIDLERQVLEFSRKPADVPLWRRVEVLDRLLVKLSELLKT